MKKTFIYLLAATALLLTACIHNGRKKSAGPVPADSAGTTALTPASELPIPDEALLQDIVMQLPAELLPAIDGEDGVQLLLDPENRSESGMIDWHLYEGECNHYNTNIRALPRQDGSWLVLFLSGCGCDCFVQNTQRAFDYRDGKLSPAEWPFSHPGFAEFSGPLVEGLFDETTLGRIRDEWNINYYFGYDLDAPITLIAELNAIDYGEFCLQCRSISYLWDGEGFVRKDGGYRLISPEAFGPYVLGEALPDTPAGFQLKDGGTGVDFVLSESGKAGKVAQITLDQPGGSIRSIEIFSPAYELQSSLDGITVGIPVSRVLETGAPQSWKAYKKDGRAIIQIWNHFYTTGKDQIEGEAQGPQGHIDGSWSHKPDATVQSILIIQESDL